MPNLARVVPQCPQHLCDQPRPAPPHRLQSAVISCPKLRPVQQHLKALPPPYPALLANIHHHRLEPDFRIRLGSRTGISHCPTISTNVSISRRLPKQNAVL